MIQFQNRKSISAKILRQQATLRVDR